MSPGASLWLLLTLSLSPSLPAHPLATADNPSPPLSPAPANPEVSWGDWLIVDEAEPGASILLRRITPKSVFIAPTVCSEGYRQDSMGRCVKVVKINQQAQWKLLLERLNSMYAPSTGNSPHKEAGPFHISLPIGGEGSQEDANVKKRVPPVIRDDHTTTTTTTTTLPTTTTMMAESPTSDLSSTDPQTESTTERRDASTERPLEGVMIGDQPVVTDRPAEADTHQNHNEPPQLPEKPFVIIVTNKPTTGTDDWTVPTTLLPITSAETVEEESSEAPSTTEGSTEAVPRYTTDYTPKANEYDDSFSDVRPTVVYNAPSSTTRPKCDTRVTQHRDSTNCDTSAESDSREKEVQNPPDSVPASYESNSRIRFPSESGYLPEQRVQSYVKFPEATDGGERVRERPTYWYPSWHVQDHPMIRGWPPSDQVLHRQYPPPYALSGHMWSDDANIWRRRFLQRD